jgi:hypothetical protein
MHKYLTAVVTLFACSSAYAAEPLTKNLVHARDIPAVKSATGAVVRTFTFPTGTIREIRLPKGSTATYPIGTETEIFLLHGAAKLDTTDLNPGDAVNGPHGTLINRTAAEDTVAVGWTVGSSVKDSKVMVFRMDQTKPEPVANWVEDGKEVYARGEEQLRGRTPTEGASRWISRRYQFDGNSIRWANFQKGGVTVWATPGGDNLIYIAKGRFRRVEGPEVAVVAEGDVVREAAGLRGHWEPLDESAFLSTTAQPQPGAARP